MTETVTLVSKDTDVVVENIAGHDVGYTLTDGTHRHFTPKVPITLTAGELRNLFYEPGGQVILQNYLRVNNKKLALEFGITEDIVEYNWTQADVDKCLLEDDMDVLLDALDWAPEGIVEQLKTRAIELEIPDNRKIQAINARTGVDISAIIRNKHVYDTANNVKNDAPKKQRRTSATTAKKTQPTQRRTAQKEE